MDLINLLSQYPLLALFVISALGLSLGNISIFGISAGTSGVLFIALACGHFGIKVPTGTGTLGLVLFTYCVGIGAGSSFFKALKSEGASLAKLGFIIVALGTLITWISCKIFAIPQTLGVGIFAGAMTSTPAMAAATEVLKDAQPPLAIGYGIAYPFGVAGAIFFVQVLPRLLKKDLNAIAAEYEGKEKADEIVVRVLTEVTNTNLFGKRIADCGIARVNACQISRFESEGRLVPLHYDASFSPGMKVLVVGRKKDVEMAVDYIGKKSDAHLMHDTENERSSLLVTKNIINKSLKEISPIQEHGVVITRILRNAMEFVPNASTVIENGDQITVVGKPDDISVFSKFIGHRRSSIGETDLLSLFAGLCLGILVGMIPISLPGFSGSFTLGMSGGPLFVALLLGHFGRVGKIVGYIPRPTRLLLQELGLVFFLADAGISGGSAFIQTFSQYGASLLIAGALITIIPLVFGYLIATYYFKMNILQSLGGICGGCTSTPALGAITAKTDSQIPVTSYATAYPIALIMMIIFARVLASLLA